MNARVYALLLIGMGILAGCLVAGHTRPLAPAATDLPNPLVIYYSGDTQGVLEPCG